MGRTLGDRQVLRGDWKVKMVKEAYERYRVAADMLEWLIELDYGLHICHNRIHKILLSSGYAKQKRKKDKRKKD